MSSGNRRPSASQRTKRRESSTEGMANGNGKARSEHSPEDVDGDAARKRKKRFKYMLESQRNGNGDGNGSEGDEEGGSGQDGDKKESRKKVKKACIFCKRSHMPCEEARPCRRCVKRGISDLCRDAEPLNSSGKSSSTTQKAESRKTASGKSKAKDDERSPSPPSPPSPSDHLVIPSVSARDPDFKPTMSISLLLSPAEVSTTRMSQAPIFAAHAEAAGSQSSGHHLSHRDAQGHRSDYASSVTQAQERAWHHNMDSSSQRELVRLLEAGPSAVDLNDVFGDKPTSLLSYPSAVGMPVGDPLRMQSARSSASLSANGNGSYDSSYHVGSISSMAQSGGDQLPPRPKHILHEEHATTAELQGIQSYSYTYGYAKLARWMQTRFSRESCEAVDRCLSRIRPQFLAISRSLPEKELLGVEEAFVRLVQHYQANVLEFVPTPTFVTRRTGEIYAANEHAARFFDLPQSLFEGGQISHFQLTTEAEVVALWELYAQECSGALKDPPRRISELEVDRSLLLFNKPGFDPRTGELLGDRPGFCEDGSPAVVRKRAFVSFEAKISQHGLPVMLVCQCCEVPTEP